ncbi:MAG: hypothetical protein UY71_C0007G0015 [Parcubacteria group bacterium GW2011_GWB1_52_7]|nr:MAG: hypothetical protein UY64_C0010G0010 [Parcubacteria group bacterium GW2011_GWA1_51_12]KKW28931.1 MAG: hypothetical protein UY71_C0007G0015 [Parcubacteria group bacterium GW2011_GWB1_52_7]
MIWNLVGMDLAQIISSGTIYFALAFIPPILWLLIYLREDLHPEPFRMILLAFAGGIAAGIAALIAERGVTWGIDADKQFIIFFAAIALIEEYAKYLSVKFLILNQPDFNEPMDAMIYMVTAGLGFAAIENILFLLAQVYDPNLLLGENMIAGAQLSAARFVGANLLHALASAVVGYFLARAWFRPRRHHWVALGILLAALLHAGFNYLIIVKDILPGAIAYTAGLLAIALVVVLIDFHKLKRESSELSYAQR